MIRRVTSLFTQGGTAPRLKLEQSAPRRASMYTRSHKAAQMTTTLSVRIDTDTKKRLEALAKRSRRSKSFLAAEAIVAFVEAESWQLDEIQTGIKELDEGRGVPHKDVANWLRSWGRKRERKTPRR
jgi:RHH-type rel operon transcriptional repressor/antitoxin RelB